MVLRAVKLDPGAVTVGWDEVGDLLTVKWTLELWEWDLLTTISNFCCHLVVS